MYLAEKIALQKKEDIDKLDLKKKFEKGINKNALKKKKIKRSEKKKNSGLFGALLSISHLGLAHRKSHPWSKPPLDL